MSTIRTLAAAVFRAAATALDPAGAAPPIVNYYAPTFSSAPLSPEAAARLDRLDAERAARDPRAP